ncbi:MAG TPA: TonB-dependent siderophore receptor [Sphingobium sp.]
MRIISPSLAGTTDMTSSHRALAVALAMMAAGTASSVHAADADADAAADAEIVVTGQRDEQVIQAGPLGARSILETPFSVAQADSEQIRRIAATTIDAAFNYDPSIRSNNSGVASGNTFSVRGQSVDLTNGYKYDGLAFPYWFQDHPIEAVEQIQVLKGAGGFVYGYASPSGVVNFVSKKPTRDLNASVDVSYRSSSILRTHFDIGGPVTDNPDGVAFRFNAVHEEGKLYNGADNKNTFAQLWLQGNVTPSLSWSLDGYYQRTWQAQQSNGIGLNAAVTNLAPVSGKLNLGSASTTKFNDIAQVTGRLNYQIAKDWKASAALRYSTLDERFPGNTATILDNSGRYQINVLNQNRVFFYYVGQLSVEGQFRTGAIRHTLVGGFDYLNIDFDYDRQPFTANGKPTATAVPGAIGNIYYGETPDWAGKSVANAGAGGTIGTRAFMRPPNWFRFQEIRQRGLFLSDTAKWGPVELMAGLRYTWYSEFNNEPVLAKTSYKENSLTPVAALSYDIAEGARVYVSYVEALQRGGQAPTTAINVGDSFGPIKSTQYEAGIKVQRANWGATLAVYKTNVPSEYVNTANVFVRDGERRFQGVEFDANWHVTKELYLKYGAAYLDAVQTAAQNSSVVGKVVPGTTGFQTSGFVEYTPSLLPGFSIFGGVRYSGKAYGQATNSFVFDPVTVGDLGLSYTLPAAGKQFKISANVQNITDTWYWLPTASGTGLSAGAPRTFSLSLNVATGPIAQDGPIRSESGVLRETGWYVGLAGGVTQTAAGNFDITPRINPALGQVSNGLRTASKPGWELAGSVGYDFGKVRGEVELSHQQSELKRVTLNSTRVAIEGTNRPAGTYDDASGTTRILALMANGLFDIGGTARSRWAFEAGGGIGIARVLQHRWQLQEAVQDTVFANENKLDFAWQALAGTRYRLTDRLEATLRYRYFSLPNAYLQTTTANALEGSFHTHSLLVGVNFRL